MKTIDEQIIELQNKKAQEQYDREKQHQEDLFAFGQVQLGKHFKIFGGASMSGHGYWTFITIEKVGKCSHTDIEVYGSTIRVHLEPAYLYKSHIFDRSWSDPEYRKSGGTNSYKVHAESCFSPSYNMSARITEKKHDGRKAPLPKSFDSATISEHPYTIYGGGIKVTSKEDFNRRFEPISQELMDHLQNCIERIQNITWNTMLKFYQEDYRKVWSEGEVLAISQDEKKTVIPYLDMLTQALNQSGRKDRINVLKAFSEFLKTYNIQ